MKLISNADGQRLDTFIASNSENYTRSYFSQLISSGNVRVNGSAVTKAGFKLSNGDAVEVDIPEAVTTDAAPEDIPLDIVYEDRDLIIINKPQGMVVHPACGHYEGTLVNALLHHCGGDLSDINGVVRPGIVHRLDKDTSGLMLAVKNNETHIRMAEMMANHEVKRVYRAMVYGVVGPNKGTIDAPISRSSKDRRRMIVNEDGKPSLTHFEVVERYREATDMKLILETGRTHQIRAHMVYIGHPVVGDPLYAPKRKHYGLSGQCLHSSSIEFIHPITGELIHFDAELPDYYKELKGKLTLL